MQSTSLLALTALASDAAPLVERGAQYPRGSHDRRQTPPESSIGKRLIGTETVLAKIPWSRTTLWRRIKDGDFPPPIRVSDGLNAWLEESVDAWIDARVAEVSQ
jgi:predicted DNA-binding transcriptional regulator AlpA